MAARPLTGLPADGSWSPPIAVLQGVRTISLLTGRLAHRVVIYTSDERPEPVARCVAAGAAAYVSKYDSTPSLGRAISEVGRNGEIVTPALHQALRELAARSCDIRLSSTLEQTLLMLDSGMSDAEVATARCCSARTIEDHKRKILEMFGAAMETRQQGFAGLARDLGVAHGDLVNDRPAHRPSRGLIARAMPWARRGGEPPQAAAR